MSWADFIPIIGPIAQAWGNRDTNQTNRDIADQTNYFSAQQAAENRSFQERMANQAQSFSQRMSNTSWQRGVADMKAAGINPMLSVSQGGASAPMGVSASGSAASGTTGAPAINPMSGVVSSGLDAMRTIADLQNLKAQNANIKAQTGLTTMQTATESKNPALKQAIIRNTIASAKNVEADNPVHVIGGSYIGAGVRALSKVSDFANSIYSKHKPYVPLPPSFNLSNRFNRR